MNALSQIVNVDPNAAGPPSHRPPVWEALILSAALLVLLVTAPLWYPALLFFARRYGARDAR